MKLPWKNSRGRRFCGRDYRKSTPVEEAPVEEAPVEEAPVEPEEASVEEAPVEEAPVEEASVEEETVDESDSTLREQHNDELVELDFDTSNLDESKIKMNAEDYLIIYKYILGQIKENKIKEIEKICESKGIDMEVLDCEEIFNDSDDEYFSSDSESETSNDEGSFN